MALVDRLRVFERHRAPAGATGAIPRFGRASPNGVVLVFIGLIYYPLFWLALMSISDRPLSGIPFPLSTENYVAPLRGSALGRSVSWRASSSG